MQEGTSSLMQMAKVSIVQYFFCRDKPYTLRVIAGVRCCASFEREEASFHLCAL